jgi:acid phosphatase
VNGNPSAIGVFDTISACVANGIELPPEFLDKKFLGVLEDAMIAQWYTVYVGPTPPPPTNTTNLVENELAQRLGIGPLLGDVLDRFTYASTNPRSPQKLALYGGHDNTLGPLLSALGVFDNRWPRSSSNVTFELFRDATPLGVLESLKLRRGEYFVRTSYNNRVLKVPGCKPVGKHRAGDESLCTLAAFREVVERVRPKDLVEECKILGISQIYRFDCGANAVAIEKEKSLPN